ncbi:MAG: universal stress protein [Cytophagales bacterium]|nr:universal stress protein [Cytophagales bacterium]
MQINNILVPIDFSECSLNALRYALTMAKDFKAKITVINGYKIPIPAADINYTFDPSIYDDYEKEMKEKFSLLPGKIPELNMVEVEYKVEMAFPVEAVEQEISEKRIDLVVMGTKGASNLAEVVIGSNTFHVAKRATCPVLAIPENIKSRKINNIAIAVDLNHENKDLPLRMLIKIAEQYNAAVHFLHVSDKPSEIPYEQAWEVLAYKKEFSDIENYFHFIENKNIEEGINDYLDHNDIDMLVLLPKKHPFFEKLFKRSVTRTMLLHAKIPLLTIN